MLSSLLVFVLWSIVLLSERSRLLAVVNAEAAQLPDCTATTDGGRCDRIHDHEGCLTRVREGAEECAWRNEPPIDLQLHNSGCYCALPSTPDFCDGEQAININASDIPVDITYSLLNRGQFTITASVKNLVGDWSYVMVMTINRATMIVGNRCTCGSTQNQELSINRTDTFNNDVKDRSLHLCLWNSSGSRRLHLVHNFSVGSKCLEFVNRHRLPPHFCNQPIDDESIGQVRDMDVQPTSVSSTLQVSWTKPRSISLLKLQGVTYYLTLNSTLGIHTFTVSDSTSVTCTVRPGLNYTVTVRTWVWCETTSCERQASASAFVPEEPPTPTPPTSSHTPPTTSATDKVGSTANQYSTNVVVIVGSASTAALILLFIIIIITITCYRWRIKERYRYSENGPSCVESRIRITNSCSSDSASTPHVDTISTNSGKISDLESDDHTDHPTASKQVPTVGSQRIPMEEHAQVVADRHTSSKQVLIVGSQKIPTEEHAQLVAAPLLQYEDIKILMHGVDTKQEDQRLPPSTWVQLAMDQAKFVVCICNKEFMDDWRYNGQKMCHEVSLVRSVSERVAGLMNHGQNNQVQEKFIAVVHCEEDLQYIPASLKNCNLFVLNCDANVERLARFLLGIPTITFQRRNVDSIDHISSRF